MVVVVYEGETFGAAPAIERAATTNVAAECPARGTVPKAPYVIKLILGRLA